MVRYFVRGADAREAGIAGREVTAVQVGAVLERGAPAGGSGATSGKEKFNRILLA